MRYLKEPSGSSVLPNILWAVVGLLVLFGLYLLIRNVIIPAFKTSTATQEAIVPTPVTTTTPSSNYVVTPTPSASSQAYPTFQPTISPRPYYQGDSGLPNAGPAEDLLGLSLAGMGMGVGGYFYAAKARLRRASRELDIME